MKHPLFVKRPLAERFWEKVDTSGGPLACWPWTASLNNRGYGQFKKDSKAGECLAHRWAYFFTYGPVPKGLELDHVKARGCMGPPCVNPAHLQPVSHRVNMLRGDNPMAKNARKTHCPQGHPLTPDNLVPYRLRRGHRLCLICSRESARRSMAKHRQKLRQEAA